MKISYFFVTSDFAKRSLSTLSLSNQNKTTPPNLTQHTLHTEIKRERRNELCSVYVTDSLNKYQILLKTLDSSSSRFSPSFSQEPLRSSLLSFAFTSVTDRAPSVLLRRRARTSSGDRSCDSLRPWFLLHFRLRRGFGF